MLIDFQKFDDGLVILGNIEDSEVLSLIDKQVADSGIKLIILDPLRIVDKSRFLISTDSNTFTNKFCGLLNAISPLCSENAATYVFGRNSSGENFYRLMVKTEIVSDWQAASKIVCESQKIMNLVTNKEMETQQKRYLRRAHTWVDASRIISERIKSISGSMDSSSLISIPISIHTSSNDWILDPFSKKGSTALLVRNMKRKFIIVESDCEDFAEAVSKLS